MIYSKDNLTEINKKYAELDVSRNDLLLMLMTFQQRLHDEKAKEYLMQGVARRLTTIYRCIQNIFSLFPPSKSEHLSAEVLTDININLHAFFINIAGVFDNLGWVYVYENALLGKVSEGKIPRKGVGLFCSDTQKHLSQELSDYLNSERINKWYTDYSKNYRDSLAHRIPLYVPPALLNNAETGEFQIIEDKIQKLNFFKESDRTQYDELRRVQSKIGMASHFLAHSLNEGSRPVYFHAQVLADFATIEEVIKKFIKFFRNQ